MDPITIGGILTAAAAALGNEAVKDAYDSVKQALHDRFGSKEDLSEALNQVEKRPDSEGRQKTLQEEIEQAGLATDDEILSRIQALETLLHQLELFPHTVYHAEQSGSGGIAQGSHSMASGKGGVTAQEIRGPVKTGDEYHFHLGGEKEDPTESPSTQARHRYLRKMYHKWNVLPLAAMGGTETGEEITLEQVYIDLDTEMPLKTEEGGITSRGKKGRQQVSDSDEEDRCLTALEVATQTRRLLLLGGPGSGKSTFASQLCACLAAANLGEKKPLPGWETNPIPLLTVLRTLAPQLGALNLDKLSTEDRDRLLIDTVYTQWKRQLDECGAGAFFEILEEALDSGNVLLVFDGLDEVAQILRPRVYEAVSVVGKVYPNVKHMILTCRTRSYSGPDMVPGFFAHRLASFDEEKIKQFITGWYNAQHELDQGTKDRKTTELQEAAVSEKLRELASNPMLLTTMAIIHKREVGLPRDRVVLYDLAVQVLLTRWQKHKGVETSTRLEALLEDARKLRMILERIAYLAHQHQAQFQQEGLLQRKDLLEQLEKPEALGAITLAAEFLDYIDQRAGLLVGHGGDDQGYQPQVYGFPHRTFQEYLAGCCLVTGRGISREYRKRAEEGDYWYLAAQYGAEELVLNRRNDQTLLDLVYDLCPETSPQKESEWRTIVWAGAGAVLLGSQAIEQDTDKPGGGAVFLNRLKERLVSVMRESPLPAIERAEAGRHLGKMGDARDEILKPEKIEWCDIPSGTFTMGEDDEAGEDTILSPYRISQFPITNAQFQAFVDADGYSKETYWPEAKADGIWNEGTIKDYLGDEPRKKPQNFGHPFHFPNHPVVGVTWYEALAFCRWLTEILHANGTLNKHWECHLPSEPEWEKAARGTDGRSFPWGNEPDPNRANYGETGIGTTSAVGCFPQGANPLTAVEEMSGNVWEWTRSVMGDYPYPDRERGRQNREALNAGSDQFRVLRGGSYDYTESDVRCAARGSNRPDDRRGSIGFRVVASPFSSSDL